MFRTTQLKAARKKVGKAINRMRQNFEDLVGLTELRVVLLNHELGLIYFFTAICSVVSTVAICQKHRNIFQVFPAVVFLTFYGVLFAKSKLYPEVVDHRIADEERTYRGIYMQTTFLIIEFFSIPVSAVVGCLINQAISYF